MKFKYISQFKIKFDNSNQSVFYNIFISVLTYIDHMSVNKILQQHVFCPKNDIFKQIINYENRS